MAEETFTPKTYADYQKFNFFRTPNWRWERVVSLIDRPGAMPGRCTKRDDDVVRQAKSFVLRRQHGDQQTVDRLMFENPGLFYAYDFYIRTLDDRDAAMYIQARLLARQSVEHVAGVMGMLPDAVKWYSELYFDVIPHLDQRDWITKQVLVPAMVRSAGVGTPEDVPPAYGFKDSTVAKPFMDGSLKLFAYFGGTHLVDLMIAGLQAGKPLTSPEDATNWLDKAIGTTVRRRAAQAAQTFEVNKYNVMELFSVHTQLVALERSEESQDQARSTMERHVKATIDEIPWSVGSDGERVFEGTAVGRFDRMSSELRDDELIRIASGQTAPTVARDNFPDRLPPPRKDKRSVLTTTDNDI